MSVDVDRRETKHARRTPARAVNVDRGHGGRDRYRELETKVTERSRLEPTGMGEELSEATRLSNLTALETITGGPRLAFGSFVGTIMRIVCA